MAVLNSLSSTDTVSQNDAAIRALAAEYAAGRITEAVYDRRDAELRERQAELRRFRETGVKAAALGSVRSFFPPKVYRRTFDVAGQLARRRGLAANGALPPNLARRFTVGELAAVTVVLGEVMASGRCSLSIKEIGDRAGVCPALVKRAVGAGVLEGFLSKEVRPVLGAKNRTNVVTVRGDSDEGRAVLAWLRCRGRSRKGIGATDLAPLSTTGFSKACCPEKPPQAGAGLASAPVKKRHSGSDAGSVRLDAALARLGSAFLGSRR